MAEYTPGVFKCQSQKTYFSIFAQIAGLSNKSQINFLQYAGLKNAKIRYILRLNDGVLQDIDYCLAKRGRFFYI